MGAFRHNLVRGYKGLEEMLSPEDLKALTGLFNEKDFEPIPIQKYEVLPFPVEVFPQTIWEFVKGAAKAINCPPDFLGVPLLCEAGVIIGTSRVIQIKKGWIEGPRIYAAVVGHPGTRKSPSLNLVMTPIYRIQKQMQAKYKEAMESYEKELMQYETKLLAWRKSKGEVEKPEEPKEPIMEQILTTDSTLEALGGLPEQNSRGILFVRDELTGWALSMDQYKNAKGADRQGWLSFWNGSPVIVNRKNRKNPILLHDPFVCVAGGLPPDVLNDLPDERGREDGFVHRILFAFPDNVPTEWVEDEITKESLESLCQLFEKLFRLEAQTDENGNVKPVEIAFTQEGKATWREFINDHYKEQEDPLFPDNLRGPWAKMEGYAARLALVLQLLRLACDEAKSEEVDDKSMSGAADLIDYFKSHAKRAYAQLRITPEDKKVLSALEWIRKQGGSVTAREVLRHHVANVKTSLEAKQLLYQLQNRGHGRIEERGKGTVTFTLAV
jgi:hypothetical protein